MRLPLEYRYRDPERPLPTRTVQGPPRALLPWEEAKPWLVSGPAEHAFDFAGHVRGLIADIAARCQELRHVQEARILLATTQARKGQAHGLQARVTPLRFAGGALTRQRRGTTYQVQRYFLGEREFLYHMTFCLPRFLDQDFDDKLVTVFHEMYHIHPECNGDLRRHDGRYHVHSHSQHGYDAKMADLARGYLATRPPEAVYGFLRLNFAQLCKRHGSVAGVVVPRPRIIPVAAVPSANPTVDCASIGSSLAGGEVDEEGKLF